VGGGLIFRLKWFTHLYINFILIIYLNMNNISVE
jgi:hypothetical protein